MNDLNISSPINFNENKNITLTSYSTNGAINSVKKFAKMDEFLLNINDGIASLQKIVFDGNKISDTRGGIVIRNTSKIIINADTTIQNFITEEIFGGGLRTTDTKATIEMNDGKIINNYSPKGSGIFIGYDASITINGGVISNNKSDMEGALLSHGNVTINGGEISNNIANINTAGLFIRQYEQQSTPTLIITGGTINNNMLLTPNDMERIRTNIYISDNVTTVDSITTPPLNFFSSKTYKIVNSADTTKVLDIADGSIADGANVQLYTYNDTDAQKWYLAIESIENNIAYYNFKIKKSEKCLDVANGETADRTNVNQYACNYTDAQRFYLVDAGEGYYYIKNKKSNKCLDVADGGTSDRSNVQIFSCNNTAAQKWKFVVS